MVLGIQLTPERPNFVGREDTAARFRGGIAHTAMARINAE
jgi:hypothetical protein